jgi:hypothetical protein
MATTSGFVISLTWVGNLVCSQIGAPGAAELLIVQFNSDDPSDVLLLKRSIVKALVRAKHAGYAVTATHGDADALIASIQFNGFDICPSRAVTNDFFTVSSANLPDDVVVDFDGPVNVVTVTPDVVRPDWVLVAQLPPAIPAVRHDVRLRSPSTGWTSNAVPVDVSSGPLEFVRRLYTGAPKDRPYTITFIGNPVIRRFSGALIADPLTTNRPSFHRTVWRSIDNMLRSTEDVLRAGGLDRHIQFACIFDATRAIADAAALVQEDNTNIIGPRRTLFRGFTDGYSVYSDVSFALCESATHTRSSAWFSTDDTSGTSVNFTYDGTNHSHGRFASIPGTIALSTSLGSMTPLHEFGHASSDFNNGIVDDLYVDSQRPGLNVNKKFRTASTNPIPATFGNYNGTSRNSDQNRDGIGYPTTWVSYHCELIDNARPNLMDNYNFADDPRRCRLDRITHQWLTDRLAAKVFR